MDYLLFESRKIGRPKKLLKAFYTHPDFGMKLLQTVKKVFS